MVAAVVLIRAAPGEVPGIGRRLATIDGVDEVYSVSGEYDLVAIVRVPQYERMAQLITEEVSSIPGIARTHTLTALRVFGRPDIERAWKMLD